MLTEEETTFSAEGKAASYETVKKIATKSCLKPSSFEGKSLKYIKIDYIEAHRSNDYHIFLYNKDIAIRHEQEKKLKQILEK